MAEIIRGTTPTLKFNFRTVNPAEIDTAYLVIKQLGQEKLRLSLSDATASANALSWTLTQEQTLHLAIGRDVVAVCDWKLQNGVRGRSEEAVFDVGEPGVKEVI